ncbi:tRNA (pseudouridine-N1)-methyltransferase [Pyrobaculum aerophilum]|uniref:tRNA (pseudouridine-N1)-methyltransferase n=1 Tax=Pyrobaculum aerophilum TaxID=13773 RepID=UPI0023EF59F4|nr:tRNA (pseudouridine-N1)-methyltransferase [Pyrobaculum aerophilum]MCX8136401.1 tRNA (pseudouridine-N1)-methyltransferase [Pyrobaculum aerophilum]
MIIKHHQHSLLARSRGSYPPKETPSGIPNASVPTSSYTLIPQSLSPLHGTPSFLIKSDIACPWSISAEELVKNRFDVLVDFVIESITGGVREVYVMLCDGSTYLITSLPSQRARAVARWLLSRQPFKTSLQAIIAKYRSVYYLHERGRDISEARLNGNGLYIFGDHDGLSREDEELLAKHAEWISLGSTPYMSWHAAAYLAYLLKRQV